MLDNWINFAEGYLLVYSIDDKESLEVIKGKYERIQRSKVGQAYSVVVVGNKVDLDKEGKREVLLEEVEKLCKLWKVKHIEASALVSII